MPTLRIALAQMNPTVGDLGGNAAKIADSIRRAEDLGADLVVFPELALSGYPPEDLLLKPHFTRANRAFLAEVRPVPTGAAVLVGFPDSDTGRVYNAAALLCGGDHVASYHKMRLPNYGVFDEARYFTHGHAPLIFDLNGARLAVTICEDIWGEADGLSHTIRRAGVGLVVNLSASPYHAHKMHERRQVLGRFAARTRTHIAYCNLVGGQDELVFDGGSLILAPDGTLLAQAPRFVEFLLVSDVEVPPAPNDPIQAPPVQLQSAASLLASARPPLTPTLAAEMGLEEEIYAALVLGTRDYALKNGFQKVVVGLSGGIDSALTAAIAADALGRERVVGVSMPSRYSSEETCSDAARVAANLGIEFLTVPIEPIFAAYMAGLAEALGGGPPGVEMENIQARIRGNILMALSNKFGWLVLTTGNKSETAVGYCTLYGDMAGGFAVIKDVLKTMVYRLAEYLNRRAGREVIPQSVIARVPTAELRPNQKDQDSLPPYDLLDRILEAYVEQDKSLEEIVAMKLDEKVVAEVIRMVDRSEYKRRQAPPGVKITPKAFGRDRRMPITNRFRVNPLHTGG